MELNTGARARALVHRFPTETAIIEIFNFVKQLFSGSILTEKPVRMLVSHMLIIY